MTKEEFWKKWLEDPRTILNKKKFMKDLDSVVLSEVTEALRNIDYSKIFKRRGKYGKEKKET